MTQTRTLTKDQGYAATLETRLPPLKEGSYRFIVRTDIKNEVYEAEGEANNTIASANALYLSVEEIPLGVARELTLAPGETRLFKVAAPLGNTMRVTLDDSDATATNELFLRWNDVPTGTAFDAVYDGPLQADQVATIPSTKPGDYYVLVRGVTRPDPAAKLTLTARLVPLEITSVVKDQGGDGRWVTVTINGADFSDDATVKLSRPGVAEFAPTRMQVIDATKIIAIFDLTAAPLGLYDVIVTNPDGAKAIEPYRYLVERAVEQEVTVGLGGPRVVPVGQAGTYAVTLQSLTNIDTPYVRYTFGIPYIGTNPKAYDIPYVEFSSNLTGTPDGTPDPAVPWASLRSDVNTSGYNLAPGYAFDLGAGGYTALTFTAQTYPIIRALEDRNFELVREFLYEQHPTWRAGRLLDAGFAPLQTLAPEIYKIFADPSEPVIKEGMPVFMPFQFNIVAAATPMTRAEFVAEQTREADRIRAKVLADPAAPGALMVIAGDREAWIAGWLAALEEAGLLRPEDQAPPIRESAKAASLMATLGMGLLLGPVGDQIITSTDLVPFFAKIREWYGDRPRTVADIARYDHRETELYGDHDVPVARVPTASEYDFGLAGKTYFQAFNVFSPMGGGDFGSDLSTGELSALELGRYLQEVAARSQQVAVIGPQGYGSDQYIPGSADLPFEIRFQNPADAGRKPGEIRIVTQLDDDLDAQSFTLGAITLGDIAITAPGGRSTFQADYDFVRAKGFVLRVTAGIDIGTRTANWLFQAIDPLTGEVIADPAIGLLPPNNGAGDGAGTVSYTVRARTDATSGTSIRTSARLLFNTAAPVDSADIVQVLDAIAPKTTLTVARVAGSATDYQLDWASGDDPGGAGLHHVSVYVAENGGAFRIWKRQITDTSAVFQGEAGKRYEFMVLGTDNVGNREQATAGLAVADDGFQFNLGSLPVVRDTDIPPPPAPAPTATVPNALFEEALQQVPIGRSALAPAEFQSTVAPFAAAAFATGLPGGAAGITALALFVDTDGSVIVSAGPNRGWLYRIPATGGAAGEPFATLSEPVFDLARDLDGQLWATTGGGTLVKLDETGAVRASYGAGITQSLALDRATGQFYVTSADGIELFDPRTGQFRHFSDRRVDDIAVGPDGRLWATSWPVRGRLLTFDVRAIPARWPRSTHSLTRWPSVKPARSWKGSCSSRPTGTTPARPGPTCGPMISPPARRWPSPAAARGARAWRSRATAASSSPSRRRSTSWRRWSRPR